MALPLPDQRLTCSVEVLACPAIKVQRTSVRAWADFTTSPWEALHDGNLWAEMATDTPSNTLVLGQTFSYRRRGLELELDISTLGPELRLGDNRTVQPVRVQGSVRLHGERSPIDIEATLEQTWGADPGDPGDPGDGSDTGDAGDAGDTEEVDGPAGSPASLTYGHAGGGDAFYLLLGAGTMPLGWLLRDGQASTIVEAERRVEEQFGPYPRRVTVQLTDHLGRRAVASGTVSNGMASRDRDELVLGCRVEWDLDGTPAHGEDRSSVDLDAWRAATRAAWGQLADAPS